MIEQAQQLLKKKDEQGATNTIKELQARLAP